MEGMVKMTNFKTRKKDKQVFPVGSGKSYRKEDDYAITGDQVTIVKEHPNHDNYLGKWWQTPYGFPLGSTAYEEYNKLLLSDRGDALTIGEARREAQQTINIYNKEGVILNKDDILIYNISVKDKDKTFRDFGEREKFNYRVFVDDKKSQQLVDNKQKN